MLRRCLPFLALAAPLCAQGVHVTPVPPTTTAPRSPADEAAAFRLPPGYRMELVAAEPLVVEPACAAFDGDGNLWVAELRTYMQDIDGTGTGEPHGVVARLRDTDGDGAMDERRDFATGLVLPRLLLPLDAHRVLIQQTYDGVLWCYHDDDGDGRADGRDAWYRYPASRANLEHQDSALIWGLDNWLYTAMGGRRHRVRGEGIAVTEDVPSEFAQWGLAVDDLGRQFFSSAGGERPAYGFQQHPVYGKFELDGGLAPGFAEVWPILAIADVQGGPGRLREDGTLNHFTGCCGQVVYRGDALPGALRGDYLIADPVGRLIRRAKVAVEDGKRVLSNAYDHAEFIASTDPNFRPTWLMNGPDGCVWVVDMYRGIIQEGNWVREGSYLRPVVAELKLDQNVARGRIWRITHVDAKPAAPRRLHGAPTSTLVAQLDDANGFWRETAQRLLVLRGDAGADAAIREFARADATSALGRVHALWTLDGLAAIVDADLISAFGDRDPRVRATGVRIAEARLAAGDDAIFDAVAALAADPDVDVRIQVLQSLRYRQDERARDRILDGIAAHATNPLFVAVGKTSLRFGAADDSAPVASFDAEDIGRMQAGRAIYRSLCVACHGPDGRGTPAGDLRLAPSLAESARLCSSQDVPVRILLHGMTGQNDGVDYAGGLMLPMGQNDDEWIAAVLTYVRNAFGNAASPVRPDAIARIRAATADRTAPYTVAEIDALAPVARSVMRDWRLSASHGGDSCGDAVDADPSTRFTTGTPMRDGMWFEIDFGSPWRVDSIELDARGSPGDYPRSYEVRVSEDGSEWSDPIADGAGTGPSTLIDIAVPRDARFLRILQTGSTDGLWWSIHDLSLRGAAVGKSMVWCQARFVHRARGAF